MGEDAISLGELQDIVKKRNKKHNGKIEYWVESITASDLDKQLANQAKTLEDKIDSDKIV